MEKKKQKKNTATTGVSDVIVSHRNVDAKRSLQPVVVVVPVDNHNNNSSNNNNNNESHSHKKKTKKENKNNNTNITQTTTTPHQTQQPQQQKQQQPVLPYVVNSTVRNGLKLCFALHSQDRVFLANDILDGLYTHAREMKVTCVCALCVAFCVCVVCVVCVCDRDRETGCVVQHCMWYAIVCLCFI